MTENKPIYINVSVASVNNYAKDYEVVSVYTEPQTIIEYWDKEQINYQPTGVKIPLIIDRSVTMALMKLKRTQEILYGDIK